MSIVITMNGVNGDGNFLIAPDGSRTFPAQLGLRTDDGSTISASLKVLPGGAAIELADSEVTVGPAETFTSIHATSASNQRNDTTLQVLVNDAAQRSFTLTAVTNLKVWFRGRFQARFATDSAPYNQPTGQGGWTFAMEGEAPFVPTGAPGDSLADSIDKPVGRQIRFHDPVDLRTEAAPIGVTVTSISGKLAGGAEEEFMTGDPLLGGPVDLGPNSYFAGNNPPPDGTQPAEGPYPDGHEPIALFEFHIDGRFSGKSLKPEDRPITFPDRGLEILTPAQLTEFGIPALSAFNAQRKSLLQSKLDAMAPADQTGTPEGRNLKTRIDRLPGTLPAGWLGREWYTGVINDAIQINPLDSAVLQFLQGFSAFWFSAAFFNFHADELCGQVLGYITSAQEETVDPFTPGPAAATPHLAVESRTISRRDPSVRLPDDVQGFL